ncbi:hypothetical protein KAU11_12625 [Candidatus Babeliales bacterium]|nr:hypothetical protein [Candidatus Babeliales bacterium]
MNTITEIFDNSEEKMMNFQQAQMTLAEITSPTRRHRFRRNIRQQLFKIRRDAVLGIGVDDITAVSGLKEWIGRQLKANMQQNWETFTFTWDVAPNDPFTVIQKEHWAKSGGVFDEHGFRIPPGFTEQEV